MDQGRCWPRPSPLDLYTKNPAASRECYIQDATCNIEDVLSDNTQGLLAVPFVLHSQPTAVYQEHSDQLVEVAADTHKRYAEIMRDVENLINEHGKSRSS